MAPHRKRLFSFFSLIMNQTLGNNNTRYTRCFLQHFKAHIFRPGFRKTKSSERKTWKLSKLIGKIVVAIRICCIWKTLFVCVFVESVDWFCFFFFFLINAIKVQTSLEFVCVCERPVSRCVRDCGKWTLTENRRRHSVALNYGQYSVLHCSHAVNLYGAVHVYIHIVEELYRKQET